MQGLPNSKSVRTAKIISTDTLRRRLGRAGPVAALAVAQAEMLGNEFFHDLEKYSRLAGDKEARDPNYKHTPILEDRHIRQGLDTLLVDWYNRRGRQPPGSGAA